MTIYRYAVRAAVLRGQRRAQILSRHRTVAAAERAARRASRWAARHGCAPCEAVCLDDDGDVTATIAECREAGTLQEPAAPRAGGEP